MSTRSEGNFILFFIFFKRGFWPVWDRKRTLNQKIIIIIFLIKDNLNNKKLEKKKRKPRTTR
jgi:hypothetical protein